jgi:putative tryptophan/tyrosine transport system substrate-binding protein
MRRRAFITLLGGAAAAWPSAARAQQMTMPVVGVLYSGSSEMFETQIAAFRKGLAEVGYVEGRNVALEIRLAEGHYHRLPSLAADLVRRQVAVIFTAGGQNSAFAAKASTPTIPIVFTTGGDPVRSGLIASLNRPGSNVTGVTNLTAELEPKRLEILHELVPTAEGIAVLVNPAYQDVHLRVKEIQAASHVLGKRIHVLQASTESAIDAAFAAVAEAHAGAVLVSSDPFFFGRRYQIVALAARYAVPAIYQWREFAQIGGLISYGASRSYAQHEAGIYVGKILKGAHPSDLPVQQAVKLELVINLNAAKALGIAIPPTILARADEVIE